MSVCCHALDDPSGKAVLAWGKSPNCDDFDAALQYRAGVLVGRDEELEAIVAVLDAARDGRSSALCLEGDPGIGKTTLLEAARSAAPDLLVLRATGVEAEFALGHAGLADVLSPIRRYLDEIPGAQRDAVEDALGWSDLHRRSQDRYLVAAGTLSLLAAAADREPILVLLDDVQWLDRESLVALTFAIRRLHHDGVAFVLARRGSGDDTALSGVPRRRIGGLTTTDSRRLLGGLVADQVVDRLLTATDGNPLALSEALHQLTPEQRRGSAALPAPLPVNERIRAGFETSLGALSNAAQRTMLLAAISSTVAAGPVFLALTREGIDPAAALSETESEELLAAADGTLRFRHPLLRAVVAARAGPAARRSAHASLAKALSGEPELRTRHLAEATIGFDLEIAAELVKCAARERVRRGYAAAADLQERAAQLEPDSKRAAEYLSLAVEDAFLSGDVQRARRSAATILAEPSTDTARARALLVLGLLEEFAGSVPESRRLLSQAAAVGNGRVRLRALAELSMVNYRLGSRSGMAAAAAALQEIADCTDPEQEMLSSFTTSAALAFDDEWTLAHPPASRALELLENTPELRDDPQYLSTAMLAAGYMDEPIRVLEFIDRRLDNARRLGALGVLPLALSLLAGGATSLGWHDVAYAYAGEAIELSVELGYISDLAISYELLAWQLAARGDHEQAQQTVDRARALAERAGVRQDAVHLDLVDAFAALCRGDLARVVTVLEMRIAIDDGRQPRGEYPLGVAPDLVEAYLGLGRRADAGALVERHTALHRDALGPDIRGHVGRLNGMIAANEKDAEAAFVAAHLAHADGSNGFEAARTRLAHGAWLRRAGRRIAARDQLRAAEAGFVSIGLDGWADRARDELATTGEKTRRATQAGDQLTSQETRVALLVARGLSNREIAAALFLSPKTIEHHVTSALRKRNMRSRTELAVAFAGR